MNKTPELFSYRADIDGLRAIAVALVILFHYEFPVFTGGYVGVDVFFVISGYLISAIITNAHEHKSFSYKEFAFRRARRLIPAYLVVVFVVFITATIMFVPEHLKATALHVPAALFYVSNLLFIGQIDYFGISTIFKPFVHTWSLSVDWQFYILWSLALHILYKFKKVGGVLFASILLVSFVGAVAFSKSASGFYFTPFRIYEFMVGYGVYAFLARSFVLPPVIKNLLLAVGLFIIFHASIAFDAGTPFPSYYALYPCIGAAAVIIGGNGPIGEWLIGNRTVSYIGRISYPIFLIHWPLYVFYYYG